MGRRLDKMWSFLVRWGAVLTVECESWRWSKESLCDWRSSSLLLARHTGWSPQRSWYTRSWRSRGQGLWRAGVGKRSYGVMLARCSDREIRKECTCVEAVKTVSIIVSRVEHTWLAFETGHLFGYGSELAWRWLNGNCWKNCLCRTRHRITGLESSVHFACYRLLFLLMVAGWHLRYQSCKWKGD